MMRSISDDDLCSECTHCTYVAGHDSHTCMYGFPGTIDKDGYVTACANATTDRLEQFKKQIVFQLDSRKEHAQSLSNLLRHEKFKDQPIESMRMHQERTEMLAQAKELQAVLDYLRGFEAEEAYQAHTIEILKPASQGVCS